MIEAIYLFWCIASGAVVGYVTARRGITGKAFIPYLLILGVVNGLIWLAVSAG